MAAALSTYDVVNTQVVLSPLAVPNRNFGAMMHVGASAVIDAAQRIRVYGNLAQVGGDFATTAPEYKAATLHFAQSPQPAILYIGRWVASPSAAVLRGGVLSATDQILTNFTGVTNGGMAITVDGTAKTVSGVNLSAVTNLNGVASAVNAALTGASLVWDATNNQFVLTSATTGTTSTLTFAAAPGSGTDLSALLKLTSTTANSPVAGLASETLDTAINALIGASADWYGAIVVAPVSDAQLLVAGQVIEAQQKKRRLFTTAIYTTVLDPLSTNDRAYALSAAKLRRTVCQYSSTSPYAVASLAARMSTVDFTGQDTTLTLKFKQQPGVTPETLTPTQAAAVRAKNANIFVNYDNNSAILQEGVNCDGTFIDEVHGFDWLENYIQVEVWNLLYSTSKVGQDDAGHAQIKARIEKCCDQGVRNGLIGPGVWTSATIGTVKQGDFLAKGYEVLVAPVATQAQADREARKSMPFQVLLKGKGAIHSVAITLYFNR